MAGGTIRLEMGEGFAVVPRNVLRDDSLSLKTKGLFSVIISLPDDWDYSVSGLAKICRTGRDAIRSSLEEMERAGYLTREQQHLECGKFGGNVYVIHASKQDSPLPENPTTVEPLPEKPLTAEPLTGNPTQYNKDLYNKDLIDTPLPPAVKKDPTEKEQKKRFHDLMFDRFWEAYPPRRRQNKPAARKAWNKIKPDIDLYRRMGEGLARSKRLESWNRDDGQYIPMPSTWLNGKRWEDDALWLMPPTENDAEPYWGWR